MATQTAVSPTILPPGAGSAYWIVGDQITFKLGPENTRGAFSFAENTAQPGGGPPPHVHGREDELFYILDGTFSFIFGEHTLSGSTGDAFYLPKGIVHTFKNVGDKPARMLVAAAPCGFERFIPEAGERCTDLSAPPPPVNDAAIARLMGACARYGLEMRFDHKPTKPAPPRPADRELWVLGQHVRLKLTSQDTGGKFSVAQATSPPGTAVPPHAHVAMDEVFYVTAGTYEFTIDGRTISAPAGTFIHVPPNALHGFRNPGPAAASLINYHSPGGFEKFFEECGVPCTDRTAPPPPPPSKDQMPRIMEIFRRHGMTVPQ
jgi:quercetin dioxygenase-like cupin family protein